MIIAGMCLLDTTDGALMLALYVQPATNFLPPKRMNSTTPLISETPEEPSSPAQVPQDEDQNHTQNQTHNQNHRDPIAFLYYSIVLTTLTVLVAIIIGVIQLLTLILNVVEPTPTGPFWDGVQTAGDYYDVIGGGICGAFLVVGILSVIVYRPWRRWVGRHGKKRSDRHGEGEGEDERREGSVARADTPLRDEEQVVYGTVSVRGKRT